MTSEGCGDFVLGSAREIRVGTLVVSGVRQNRGNVM